MNKPMTRIVLAAALAVPAGAQAALHVLTANLNAAQEVQNPTVVSPAVGTFHAVYDDATNTFTYMSLVGQGLVGATISGLHIHGRGAGALAGANSSISLGLPEGNVVRVGSAFFFNATGLGGGTIPGSADTDTTKFNQQDEANLLSGRSYINLHTNSYPSGEIRGQIAVVPEPETYALMLAGLGLVGWAAARRRKVGV